MPEDAEDRPDSDGSELDSSPKADAGAVDDAEHSSQGSTEEAELRAQVEDAYDFDDFGPRQMAEMSGDEWEAAFDESTWITGEELLARVEQDLHASVERRDVFAIIERELMATDSGTVETVLAYSDEGYAIVYPDGTVEGQGTVLRDVKPVVALCSMEDYEPDAPVGDGALPDPDSISEGSSELGNRVMQAVGLVQLLAGGVLLIAWVVYTLSVIIPVIAVGFLIFGTFILALVANARLADRFRAEEYEQRLRSAGVGTGDRPSFVPDGVPKSELDAAGEAPPDSEGE